MRNKIFKAAESTLSMASSVAYWSTVCIFIYGLVLCNRRGFKNGEKD
jgi:hypothetical protein